MSRLSERNIRDLRNTRDIARELAESESFEPPAGLLEKIKAEIPQEIRVGTVVSAPASRSFVPRQRWLIAASLVAAVGAGLVSLRTWQAREDESLKVEAHLSTLRSEAKAAPSVSFPAPPAVPSPSSPKAVRDRVAVADAAPEPAAAPKPEALQRRDLASLGYVAEGRRVQPPSPPQPPLLAQPVQVPQSSNAPGVAFRGGGARVESADEAAPFGGAPGTAANAAPAAAAAESQAPRRAQETGATAGRLDKQLSLLKEEKAKKAEDANDALRPKTLKDAPRQTLSTFGLHGGASSYTSARRDVAAGHLPDPASVRVEEWVSSIDYGDPAPAQGDFAIRAEGSRSLFTSGPEYRLLRINLKARGLPGLLQTVAKHAWAQVELNSVVVAHYRMVGSESRATAEEPVELGPMDAGQSVTLLYEIELRQGVHWEQPVGAIHLRYELPLGGKSEILRRVGLESFAPSWEEASPALRLAGLVAELAEILQGSPRIKNADLGDVARRLREVAKQLPGNAKAAEVADLAERAARIRARP